MTRSIDMNQGDLDAGKDFALHLGELEQVLNRAKLPQPNTSSISTGRGDSAPAFLQTVSARSSVSVCSLLRIANIGMNGILYNSAVPTSTPLTYSVCDLRAN